MKNLLFVLIYFTVAFFLPVGLMLYFRPDLDTAFLGGIWFSVAIWFFMWITTEQK
jgi:hypothetical protein